MIALRTADRFAAIASSSPRPRAEAPRCRSASAARYVRAVGQMAKVLALRGKESLPRASPPEGEPA